ncbi:uncharacterized protein BYT42DRAFT_610678 [Radiomyces spectabilis]|uniref:uncharacterized protein n=1 Tax=Radiomyces spectabilis TaxID=64574 RepID=UPI00221E8C3F|nr:uncharacterized protein BYT42DRAFT_610678 [Radiomyces spectabilis]KAI8391447.1 hypothetical protein BYT42DRAFT_610678 [Radiomyces spectabilis]
MTGTFKWHSCSGEDFPLKRYKVPKACNICRAKKMRCDGKLPCSRCKQNKYPCNYDGNTTKNRPTVKKASLNGNTTMTTTASNDRTSPEDTSMKRETSSSSQERFCLRSLRKLKTPNDLFASIRLNIKQYLSNSQVQPLLMDYFHITTKPPSIWTKFIRLFRKWHASGSIITDTASELIKEVMAIFMTHNSLYSTFIDYQEVAVFLDLSPLSILLPASNVNTTMATHTPSEGSVPIVDMALIYSIFALVFLAAYQTLETPEDLLKYAYAYYRQAHQQFLEASFPSTTSPSLSSSSLLKLAQTSILLSHFQCSVICEEQALIMVRIGLGFVQRCDLPSDMGDHATNRRFSITNTILTSWHVWLSFYLQRDNWITMDPQPPTPQLPMSEIQGKEGEVRWTAYVLELYTQFLTKYLRSNHHRESPSHTEVQNRLKTLERASNIFQISSASPDHDRQIHSGIGQRAHIVALYHEVLKIQLFATQLPQSIQFFLNDNRIGNKPIAPDTVMHDQGVNTSTVPDKFKDLDRFSFATLEKTMHSANHPALQVCISAANAIIDLIHQDITQHQETKSHFPTCQSCSLFYPLCLAASVLVFTFRQQKFTPVKESAKPTDHDTTTTWVSLFHLRDVLRHFTVHKEVANMLFVQLSRSLVVTANPPWQQAINEVRTNKYKPAPMVDTPSSTWVSNLSDEALTSMIVPTQGRFMNQASMSFPPLDVVSRADVDREQLNKLSHNMKPAHHHGLSVKALSGRKRSAVSRTSGNHDGSLGQKRDYFSSTFPDSTMPQANLTPVPTSKKLCPDRTFDHDTLMRGRRPYDLAIDLNPHPHVSNDPSAAALHMYTNEYLMMLPMQHQLESSDPIFYTTTMPHRDRVVVPPTPGSSSSSSGSSFNTMITPKLPLPQPTLQNTTSKYYSSRQMRYWNECFTSSVRETLHNGPSIPLESSFGTALSMSLNVDDPSTLDPTTALVSPSTGQPSIDGDNDQGMVFLFNGTEEQSLLNSPPSWISSQIEQLRKSTTDKADPRSLSQQTSSGDAEEDKDHTHSTAQTPSPWSTFSAVSIATQTQAYASSTVLMDTIVSPSVTSTTPRTVEGPSVDDSNTMFTQDNHWISTKISDGDVLSWN